MRNGHRRTSTTCDEKVYTFVRCHLLLLLLIQPHPDLTAKEASLAYYTTTCGGLSLSLSAIVVQCKEAGWASSSTATGPAGAGDNEPHCSQLQSHAPPPPHPTPPTIGEKQFPCSCTTPPRFSSSVRSVIIKIESADIAPTTPPPLVIFPFIVPSFPSGDHEQDFSILKVQEHPGEYGVKVDEGNKQGVDFCFLAQRVPLV